MSGRSLVLAVTGDSNKNAETRRALQPIVELAERIGCALLGISHYSKGTAGRDPVERVTGSVAFGALPRVVLAAVKTTTPQGRQARDCSPAPNRTMGRMVGAFTTRWIRWS